MAMHFLLAGFLVCAHAVPPAARAAWEPLPSPTIPAAPAPNAQGKVFLPGLHVALHVAGQNCQCCLIH